MPIVKKKPVAGVPFLDMSTYSEGGANFDIPEGDYAVQYRVTNEKFADGSMPVGAKLTCMPLRGGDTIEKFIKFGTGMEDSWMPSEDGMSVVENPNFPEDQTRKAFSKKSNWGIHLKSLYDVAPDIPNLSDSFEPIDGIWVTIQNIPEPAERASYNASTAEEAEKKKKFPAKIPVITAIIEGGKPWEGGGGFDFATAAAPKTTVKAKVAPLTKPGPVGVKKAAPPVVVEETEEEEVDENEASDAATVAGSAVAAFLSKNKAGSSSAMLQTQVFSAVKKEHGAEMAQAVMSALQGDGYEAILGMQGFKLAGALVKPAK